MNRSFRCIVTRSGDIHKLQGIGVPEAPLASEGVIAPGVLVEIVPPKGDVFAPVTSWVIKICNKELPEWFSDHVVDAFDALSECLDRCRFIGQDDINFNDYPAKGLYIKECKIGDLTGSTEVAIMQASTVKNMEDATIHELEDSQIESVSGESIIKKISGFSAIGNLCGDSIVDVMQGNGMVVYMSQSSVMHCLRGKGQIRSMTTDSTVLVVRENSVVSQMTHDSTIGCVKGSAVVESMTGRSVVQQVRENGKVLSMSGQSVVKKQDQSAIVMHQKAAV